MDIKTFLKEEIKNMKPKTVFKLTDIYSGDNPKDAGKKLSELVNKSEVEETIYLGKNIRCLALAQFTTIHENAGYGG